MTYKLVISKNSQDDWWDTEWWNNFETHCLSSYPDNSSTQDFLNEHLASYSATYNIKVLTGCHELIFNSFEDYFAFVLEWS